MTVLPHPATGMLFPSPVPPGTGWPGDLASESTPVAADPSAVATLSSAAMDLDVLTAMVSVCRACPRLVAWRESVAMAKRRAFQEEPYWGRPVPGWGAAKPRVLIVGLAPAAHGGNRTGRVFTGDRSGEWLFGSLHRVGLAASASSRSAADGQRLDLARVLAIVRCAPPDNKPTVDERDACSGWLDRELLLVLGSVRVVVCLGSYAWDAMLHAFARIGRVAPRPKPRFGHGSAYDAGALTVLGSYHPSQQNTSTKRLTEAMLDDILGRAARLAGVPDGQS